MCDDTRTRILNAAGPIFGGKGFQAATIREICQSAGVNLASVNYYFGDKDTLYIETVKLARRMRASQAPMPDLSRDKSPEARLRIFIRTLVTRMVGIEDASWQAQLMMREMLQPTKACQEVVEEYIRPEFNLLLGILSELLPRNTSDHVLCQMGFSVVGQCLFYRVADDVVRFIVPSSEIDKHYSVEQLTDHIFRTSRAALGVLDSSVSHSSLSHVGHRP